MKKMMLTTALTLFAFWAGLCFGYHEGVNNEQRAWFSTAQIEKPDRQDVEIVYKYPHSRVRVS